MTITEILSADYHIADILMREGMHCITCEAAAGESLEDACAVHGIPAERVDLLVEQINDFLGVEAV